MRHAERREAGLGIVIGQRVPRGPGRSNHAMYVAKGQGWKQPGIVDVRAESNNPHPHAPPP
eukprot:6836003-Pyramimonas_sp.AAC.1